MFKGGYINTRTVSVKKRTRRGDSKKRTQKETKIGGSRKKLHKKKARKVRVSRN